MPQIDDDDLGNIGWLEEDAEFVFTGLRFTDNHGYLLSSIAISLKRIADRLDAGGELLGRAVAKSRVE